MACAAGKQEWGESMTSPTRQECRAFKSIVRRSTPKKDDAPLAGGAIVENQVCPSDCNRVPLSGLTPLHEMSLTNAATALAPLENVQNSTKSRQTVALIAPQTQGGTQRAVLRIATLPKLQGRNCRRLADCGSVRSRRAPRRRQLPASWSCLDLISRIEEGRHAN